MKFRKMQAACKISTDLRPKRGPRDNIISASRKSDRSLLPIINFNVIQLHVLDFFNDTIYSITSASVEIKTNANFFFFSYDLRAVRD